MGNSRLLLLRSYCHPSLCPARRKGFNDGLMATPTALHHHRQGLSLGELSTELLVLVLEALGDFDTTSLGVARLLSRRFNAIATPIKYRSLRLSQRIIAPLADVYFPSGIANICAHTRHLSVDSTLDVERVRAMLAKIQNLSTIRWRYIQDGSSRPQGGCWMLSDTIRSQGLQMKGVKLYIEDMPLCYVNPGQPNPYLAVVPTEILESLKIATPSPPLTARLGSLKVLLVNCPRLKTFWYNDRGQGTHFVFDGDERLPPFKELSLRSYNWNHNTSEVRRHWDFSKIRRLDLADVPLGPFLDSVLFTDFRDLQRLRLDDFSAHLPDRRQDITSDQYTLIKQIKALVELELTCHVRSFPIDGISQHAPSLQRLRIRDYVGFSDERRRCPTIAIEDLGTLAFRLVYLRDLELDMDEKTCEARGFLHTLCSLRQLRTLALHTQTVVDPSQDEDEDTDLDRERAMQIFSFLVRGKQGVSWRSITINIGGWKPIMIRRLSSSWREKNSRGIYAERCFVLERGEEGALAVREEQPIVAT